MWEAIRENPSIVPFGLAGLMLLLLFFSLRSGQLRVGKVEDQRLADKDSMIATLKEEIGVLRESLKVKDTQIEAKDKQIGDLSIVHDFQKRAWAAVERLVAAKEREGP